MRPKAFALDWLMGTQRYSQQYLASLSVHKLIDLLDLEFPGGIECFRYHYAQVG